MWHCVAVNAMAGRCRRGEREAVSIDQATETVPTRQGCSDQAIETAILRQGSRMDRRSGRRRWQRVEEEGGGAEAGGQRRGLDESPCRAVEPLAMVREGARVGQGETPGVGSSLDIWIESIGPPAV